MLIYGLYSTEDEKIRYIGKTKFKLSKRLTEHVNGALLRNGKTYKDNWIRKVYNKGYEVKITQIEECDDGIWEERENYWINQYNDLTNLTDGGDGGHGFKYKISYNEAKEYIASLPFKITSRLDFLKKIDLIDNKIPKNPREHFTITNEWISWGDFLGTNKIQDNKKAENYLSYKEAKKFLKKKKFRYMKEYHNFVRKENINFLPYKADRFYKDRGWISWMDFLGTVKPYPITEELLRKYMKKFFPNIKSEYAVGKIFMSKIHNAIRFKYFQKYNWNGKIKRNNSRSC